MSDKDLEIKNAKESSEKYKSVEATSDQTKKLETVVKEDAEVIDKSVKARMEIIKRRNNGENVPIIAFLDTKNPAWNEMWIMTQDSIKELSGLSDLTEREKIITQIANNTESIFRQVPAETNESSEVITA